jgi:hypothetical protein
MIVLLQWALPAHVVFNYNNYKLGVKCQNVASAQAQKRRDRGRSGAAATGAAAGRLGRGKRFVHDAPDRAGTSPALSAATETMIDLAGSPRRRFVIRQRGTHVVVGEHVAGTDDHRSKARKSIGTICN